LPPQGFSASVLALEFAGAASFAGLAKDAGLVDEKPARCSYRFYQFRDAGLCDPDPETI